MTSSPTPAPLSAPAWHGPDVTATAVRPRGGPAATRIRFVLVGAVAGVAWAASLRAFMQQLAGPDSTFIFAGTFGIIIPAGVAVGALLGWAGDPRPTGSQHR